MTDDGYLAALDALARTLIGLATCWTIGTVCTAAAIMPRAGLAATHPAFARIGRFWARRGAEWLMAAYVFRLYIRVVAATDTWLPTSDGVSMLLFQTRGWGHGVIVQISVAAGAAIWLRFRSRTSARGIDLWVTACLLAAAVPLTGHMIARGGFAAAWPQAVHVFAIGAWLGSLTVIVLAWRAAVFEPTSLPQMFQAFSPVAMLSVAALLLTGIVASAAQLRTIGDLVESPYGRVLVAKVLVFAAAGALGWRHRRMSRRATPTLLRAMSRTVVIEVVFGVVALLLAAVLSGMPRPGDL